MAGDSGRAAELSARPNVLTPLSPSSLWGEGRGEGIRGQVLMFWVNSNYQSLAPFFCSEYLL